MAGLSRTTHGTTAELVPSRFRLWLKSLEEEERFGTPAYSSHDLVRDF